MAEFNDNIWAPWRMEYIRSLGEENERTGGCFFCDYFENPQQDREHHVLWREADVFVMMNRFPYTNGHLLIAPTRHCGDPSKLNTDELVELTKATYTGVEVVRKAFGAEGFNVGCNLGRCAGAGVPDHLHNHVVPRWSGDTNYMAVLGGTRVIPDGLDAAYERLMDAARELKVIS
ncbi:MAG: HIT domain-containing protein [Planctomycetes bacterium]|nr:HIT domain-containing protein [Planctomycetota bacterium]